VDGSGLGLLIPHGYGMYIYLVGSNHGSLFPHLMAIPALDRGFEIYQCYMNKSQEI